MCTWRPIGPPPGALKNQLGALDRRRERVARAPEPAVGKERAARRAASEPAERLARLLEAPLADELPRFGVRLVPRAVGDDEDVEPRSVVDEDGERPAAAERLVVGVRRQDEDAPRPEAGRLVRQETSLGERVRGGGSHAARFYRPGGRTTRPVSRRGAPR